MRTHCCSDTYLPTSYMPVAARGFFDLGYEVCEAVLRILGSVEAPAVTYSAEYPGGSSTTSVPCDVTTLTGARPESWWITYTWLLPSWCVD